VFVRGIEGTAQSMPDAHCGYGFPIGGVAAFDVEQDGIISAGGISPMSIKACYAIVILTLAIH